MNITKYVVPTPATQKLLDLFERIRFNNNTATHEYNMFFGNIQAKYSADYDKIIGYIFSCIKQNEEKIPPLSKLYKYRDLAVEACCKIESPPENHKCNKCINSGHIRYYKNGYAVVTFYEYQNNIKPESKRYYTEYLCTCDCKKGKSLQSSRTKTVNEVFPAGYNAKWSLYRDYSEELLKSEVSKAKAKVYEHINNSMQENFNIV